MPTKTNKSQTPIPLLIIYRQKTNIKKNHTSHPHQTHSNRLSLKRKTETKTQTVLRDMQPERDRGGTSEEDRRLKPMAAPDNQQQQQHQQQQQQQPQKCPRCESLNTKFCYYNNYSLSQPRYFCKTCRRYWTQGGTLRNVPVGGGCRKGKRAKTSSSSENSRSQTQTPPPPAPPPSQAHQQVQQNLTAPSKIMSSSPVTTTSPAGMRTMEPGALPSQYYPGAGYFSSLAAIQSLNQPQTFNHQELDAGCELGSSSNMSLLQGFNVSTFGSQHHQPHQIQPSQFYQMGSRDKSNFEPLNYPSEENLLQTAGRHASSSSPHDHWPQSFMNNSTTTSMASESALWNMGNNNNTATGSVHTKTTTSSGPSFNPNQWPDLPGYGPPP